MKTELKAILSIVNDQWASKSIADTLKWREMSEDQINRQLEAFLSYYARMKTEPFGAGFPSSLDVNLMKLVSSKQDKYFRLIDNYTRHLVGVPTLWDEDYPQRLKNTPNPPLIIYHLGMHFPGTSPIAIVGTRKASKEGIRLAYEFSRHLAKEGNTIVSGLARGIDTAAHKGALSTGNTIAVLGGDLLHIYPPENTSLAEDICARGSIVSEVTDQVKLHRGRFVERNRITSGLSDAVIVVESSGQGGTIRQVEIALMQKRPTFVISQDRYQNEMLEEGFHIVRKMGAIPVTSPEEISAKLEQKYHEAH